MDHGPGGFAFLVVLLPKEYVRKPTQTTNSRIARPLLASNPKERRSLGRLRLRSRPCAALDIGIHRNVHALLSKLLMGAAQTAMLQSNRIHHRFCFHRRLCCSP